MNTLQTQAHTDELLLALNEAASRTVDLVADLTPEQMMGPLLPIINPMLWDIGHGAWFLEFWVLRHLHRQSPIIANADELYNSAEVAHDTRWDLPLPSKDDTIQYKRTVLNRVTEACGPPNSNTAPSDSRYDECYFLRLALFHEYMHAEALTYTRQTLGYPAPRFSSAESQRGSHNHRAARDAADGDATIPCGSFSLGASQDAVFAFDNEQWAHSVTLKPFAISKTAVSNREFAAFVADGGYQRRDLWTPGGWQWREQAAAEHPVYWQPQVGGRWLRRNFDQWAPLEENSAVLHVNWFEADAYCRWARRRLPSEAEWEMAAAAETASQVRELGQGKRRYTWGDDLPGPGRANLDWREMGCVDVNYFSEGDSAFGCRQMIGNVWEWTATDFGPYPGFSPGPYKEYSAPWFGDHKVLRGGCWATRSNLISNVYRNFYKPDRRDVWAGFRTCAP